MKHTVTRFALAAAALAAAIPLAAQAQTSQTSQTSQLSIVIGPEPAIEPIITCGTARVGKLIPYTNTDGTVKLFTTDPTEGSGYTAQIPNGEDITANATEPGLTFGWTYGSSTATKFVRLQAQVPLDIIVNTITGQQTADPASWTIPAIATSGNAASSHVFLKGLDSLAATGASVTQSWSGNTLTVDIKKGTDALAARAATTTNLDITLQAPVGLHLRELTGGTPVTITWTCSLEPYVTTGG